MRIINGDIVGASCFTPMDGKDVTGEPVPVTDLKYSPDSTTNSNDILSPYRTPSMVTPSENEDNQTISNSGRFKFYKDGKFILELWHHKNGERMFWIPVLKNSTCWSAIGQCTPQQESSTSFSVSDDNLSVQSSSWQRDHFWKQPVPRKNINREREFMMHIARPRKIRFPMAAIQKRRRRPYDAIVKCEVFVASKYHASFSTTACNVDLKSLPPIKMEVEPFFESEHLIHSKVPTHRKLNDVLQKLLDRRLTECIPAISSCRTDPGVVSPRKRILREIEKVSLEELVNANKKYKTQTALRNCSNSGSTVAPCSALTERSNTATPSKCSLPPSAATIIKTTLKGTPLPTSKISIPSIKTTSSHGISSILCRDEEQLSFLRNLLKSRTHTCPSNISTVSTTGELLTTSLPVSGIPICDSVTRCSTSVISALASPLPQMSSSGLLYSTASERLAQQLSPSLHLLTSIPTYITPSALYHSTPQSCLASPPISNHPSCYPASAATEFHETSSVWSMPSVSSLGQHSIYPSTSLFSSYPKLNLSPWVPTMSSLPPSYPVSENETDVPLNLSKH